MDLSHLNEANRAQIEAFIHGHPKRRQLVEQMLSLRAAKKTDAERRALDKRMMWLVRPSERTWLLWGLVAVPVVAVIAWMVHDRSTHETALHEGTPVVARIERVADGNCLFGTKATRCLELSLRLWPTAGAPYTATLTHQIDTIWFSRVQPGSLLTVVVDKNDTQRVTFDERAMQVAAPTLPAGAQP